MTTRSHNMYDRQGKIIMKTDFIIDADGAECFYNAEGVLISKAYNIGESSVKHREDGPAAIVYYKPNTFFDGDQPCVMRETWFIAGNMHRRDGGPTVINYYELGRVHYEQYHVNGSLRLDKPNFIEYYTTGNKKTEAYYENGSNNLCSKTDGPCLTYYRNNAANEKWLEIWIHNNKISREDGPAIVKYGRFPEELNSNIDIRWDIAKEIQNIRKCGYFLNGVKISAKDYNKEMLIREMAGVR